MYVAHASLSFGVSYGHVVEQTLSPKATSSASDILTPQEVVTPNDRRRMATRRENRQTFTGAGNTSEAVMTGGGSTCMDICTDRASKHF